ncbi:C-type lectin domain family 14 member A [Triplophysa rosa]|uniref:C-type lectin domain family 14 member A n=1 Tax=Triplophysa rosa TaxID=992332 RepID=A0A9W7WML9_TRIRA|nr:C-type lectin domain family 14 member A [Triplophysa rosa]KAI7804983.1 C-type lectin domain family 14 member A precursor [Triplophysa rosa]
MELWTGLYLVSVLNVAFGSPGASYSIHLNELSFKDALNHCKPGGFLTNLTSEAEIAEIQKAIWEKNNKTASSFWIGLKKKKGQCVDQNKPLKGFRWTADDGEYSHDIKWKKDPMMTCTDELCGLLWVEYSDSETKSSGLGNAACKQKHAFICKRNFEVTCPSPSILGTHDIVIPPNDPYTRHITCGSGAKFTLKCTNNLLWNIEGDENSDVSQLCLQCKSGYRRDASGNCADVNECEPSNPCKRTCLNTDGSFKCTCLDNEDSDVCSESTTPTTDLENNDVHPTYSDVNVVPPDGVSRNETAVEIEEQDGVISNIVVPVIIALLIFVVLLVLAAAVLKGCLRRRSMKLAQKKAEAVALNGSNSTENGNEHKHQSERDCKL